MTTEERPATDVAAVPELYLDLLKQALTRYLVIGEGGAARIHGTPRERFRELRGELRRPRGTSKQEFRREQRRRGLDHPAHAETMIGLHRLDSLQSCITDVLEDDVPGDLIETGVWRGGSTIFMRAVLAAYGDPARTVWVADSFQGLPPPSLEVDDPIDLSKHDHLAIGVETVKANFRKYGLLDDRVQFLVGWFKDTLATAPIDQLAVARLDGDYYESTMDALDALYPKLSVGGYLIVDDYGAITQCAQAVTDYRDRVGIKEPIVDIDGTGVYWRRER